MAVLRTLRRAEYLELAVLFFLLGGALGMWVVPLSNVLDAHGLRSIKPFAFATGSLAAFVSPLIFGAMADRHASPTRVLRGLSLASAGAMGLVVAAIKLGGGPWLVVGLIQIYALCASPTFSITSAIVFARLADAEQEFGPVRAMATLGWMAGGIVVSALSLDASVWAGGASAALWLAIAGWTWMLPVLAPPATALNLRWHERLGLDALTLLKNRDHRAMFIVPALFCIPIAAFYPAAPVQLRELGLERTSAWMSLGQISEIIALGVLGTLLVRWRLKWIVACGLGFGVLRFALGALDGPVWVLTGVFLHGCSFTLVLITAQIYLDQRVDKAWRARGQALLSLTTGGVGNLVGYLSTGWWWATCTTPQGTRWSLFWGVLALTVAAVMAYFLVSYRGLGPRSRVDAA
jgi:MFS family permease